MLRALEKGRKLQEKLQVVIVALSAPIQTDLPLSMFTRRWLQVVVKVVGLSGNTTDRKSVV